MTKFDEWCQDSEASVASHKLRLLTSNPAKRSHAVKVVARAIPEYYASPQRVSGLLKRLGRTAAANYVATKLPTTPSIKSGDLGEILCNAYILEATPFTSGVKRLRWKDHRNMSMRGEDVLAFKLRPHGTRLKILKAEVKSRVAMRTKVVEEARNALSSNNELPSSHALSFIADRLDEVGDKALKDALDDALLKGPFKVSQITHMLFTFSANDPTSLLTKNLSKYKGSVPQIYVALQVNDHQAFIDSVFSAVKI